MNISLTGLASYLVRDNLLDITHAQQFIQQAKQENLPFVTYLVKNHLLNSQAIAHCCVKNFGLTLFDLEKYQNQWLQDINPELIRQYHFLPMQYEKNVLHIAISDPTDKQTLDAIVFHIGSTINPVIVLEKQLSQFIEKNLNEQLLTLPKELFLEENKIHIQESMINYDEPLIHFVDNLIQHAIRQSASDIHIEPFENICQIRYRKDGILYKMTEIPSQLATRLVTRLKVMAKLDITERRLPQDGRLQRHQIDIRISSCPIAFGEKIVLRLLYLEKSSLDINELGFNTFQKNLVLEKIKQPQGLILVTGPTGSGKTVTLYSALTILNSTEKNILTIEDPVEIQLQGINQVSIHAKIGLNFATTLRTFLRQDPDIIMVGEIRDHETAEIAIQAAHTGHLVLSTLHTNSAIETLNRLQAMSIAEYNIISSISLIIAQRLVRKLCQHCKLPDNHSATFRAKSCKHCLHGYHGRIGIYEVLPMTEKIAELILNKKNSAALLKQAKQEGFQSLRETGLEKVNQGITSLTEINRVIQ